MADDNTFKESPSPEDLAKQAFKAALAPEILAAYEFQKTLFADLHQAYKDATDFDALSLKDAMSGGFSEFRIRTVTRTSVSVMEAQIWALKQDLTSPHPQHFLRPNLDKLSPAELACLAEERYSIDNGSAKVVDLKPRLADNIKFTIAVFQRVTGTAVTVDYTGEGWKSLLATIDKRNALTHPKGIGDLRVTVKDLDGAAKAADWLNEQIQNLLMAASPIYRALVEAGKKEPPSAPG